MKYYFLNFLSNQALHQLIQQRKVPPVLDQLSGWPFQVTQWHRSLWLLLNGLDKIVIIRASFSSTGNFLYSFKPHVLQQLQINLNWFHPLYLQTQRNMDLLGGIETMELNSAINITVCWSYLRGCNMRLCPHHRRAYPAPLKQHKADTPQLGTYGLPQVQLHRHTGKFTLYPNLRR